MTFVVGAQVFALVNMVGGKMSPDIIFLKMPQYFRIL